MALARVWIIKICNVLLALFMKPDATPSKVDGNPRGGLSDHFSRAVDGVRKVVAYGKFRDIAFGVGAWRGCAFAHFLGLGLKGEASIYESLGIRDRDLFPIIE